MAEKSKAEDIVAKGERPAGNGRTTESVSYTHLTLPTKA